VFEGVLVLTARKRIGLPLHLLHKTYSRLFCHFALAFYRYDIT
jgi:hypothetical protein